MRGFWPGFWLLVSFALAVLAVRIAVRAARTASELRREVDRLRGVVSTVVAELEGLRPAPSTRAESRTDETPVTPSEAAVTSVSAPAPPEPVPFPPPPPALPALPSERPGDDTRGMPVFPDASAAEAGSPPVSAPVPAHEMESLETRIGGRWLLYLGIAALVLGVSYFIKFAFDNEWITERARVVLGLCGGLALVGLGQRFVSRGLELYGQALTGAGLGVLYLSLYAALRWYELVGRPVAFAGMVAVTAAGVWLADRQRSQVLAMLALVVGFATPFLVGGEGSAQVTLFSYVLVLVVATVFLARRRAWPALNLVSYIATVLTLSTWAERYWRPSAWLTTELFLTAFLVLFLLVLQEQRRATGPLASLTTVLLSLSPVLYHLASLSVLRRQQGPLLVYFIAFSVAGVIVAGQLRAAWLRLLVWAAVALPFLQFVAMRLSRGWLVAAWIALLAIYGLHLIAQAQTLDEDRESLPAPEVMVLHGNAFWLLACMAALGRPRTIDLISTFGFALAGFYGALAFAARRWHRDAAVHLAGLAGALAAIAFAIELRGPALVVALAAEGVVLVWLGLRAQRGLLRWGGLTLLAVATLLACAALSEPAPTGAWLVFNGRTLSCVFTAAALIAAAWLFGRPAPEVAFSRPTIAVLIVAANVLGLFIVSAEINAFYAARVWQTADPRSVGAATSAELARQLTLSMTWAAYALALVAAGLRWSYRPVRYLAIALFALTAAKVGLVDLARLERVYRMLSVMGLGILLLVASYLYQRLRRLPGPRDGAGATT